MLTCYSSRRLARLAAIQGLYQFFQTEDSCEAIIAQYTTHHFVTGHLQSRVEPDLALFQALVKGVKENNEALEEKISILLSKGWKIDRLSLLLACFLKSAAFELSYTDVPKTVALNEYIELAKDFFTQKEIGFLNGLLDQFSRKL